MTQPRVKSLHCLSILPFLPAYAFAAPPVIERYPGCEYEVLDTVNVADIVNFEKVSTSATEMAESVALLIDDLRNDAQEVQASGIAIIGKQLKQTRNQHAKLTLSAEFIGDCKAPEKGQGTLTPYSAQGQKQNSLSLGTISFGHTITIDTNRHSAPLIALGDDTRLNLTSGLYGLPLGATKQQMLDTFGPPTFEMALSENSRLFAYGRDHWLTFVDDALIKMRSGTDLFTRTFINYLPFDERFDDRTWHVTEVLGKSASLTPAEAKTQSLSQSSADASLQVMTETYTKDSPDTQEVRVTGFDLSSIDVQAPKDLPALMTDNRVLAFLSEQLQKDDGSLAFSEIPYTDIGRTRATRDGQYHLFNAFTLIEVMGQSVTDIYINPNFVASINAEEGAWRFDNFYFGQSEDEALAAAGDMAFYFDHILEYEGENFTAKIFLERQDGEYKVYSMEISVY